MSLLLRNVILKGKKLDLFIEQGAIKRIGKNLNLSAKEKIDGQGKKAILPGLINCHTHSAMVLFRGFGDDLPLKEWLEKKIWPKEERLTPDDVYWGTKLAILEMIKTGTTTFNDMYWFPQAQIAAVKEMGMRAEIGFAFTDSSPDFKRRIEKFFEIFEKEIPGTIKLSIAPHAIYTVSKENLIWAKNFAKRHNLNLHMHLSETESEVEDCKKKHRMTPVQYLEKIGFLGKPRSRTSSLRGGNCILAHSIWLSEKEIDILKKRRCSLVYNPCSNMKLASGVFPYKRVKEGGVNICLGTDGTASNNSLNMFLEMKFASLLQKVHLKDPTIAPAKEIFELVTKNGAKALKIKAGEVKEGYLGDLILVDLNKISLLPGYDLFSDLVYSFSGGVSDVICNGKILMREGKIKDEEKIKERAKELKIVKEMTR